MSHPGHLEQPPLVPGCAYRQRHVVVVWGRISLAEPTSWSLSSARAAGGDGEPGQGEHGQGDVAVPRLVEADLIVVQACLVLAGLEALHQRVPATSWHAPTDEGRPGAARPRRAPELCARGPALDGTGCPAMSLPFPLRLRRALLRLAGFQIGAKVSPVTGPRSPVYHRKDHDHSTLWYFVGKVIRGRHPKRTVKTPILAF